MQNNEFLIAGKKYNLQGDNTELTEEAVALVNSRIEEIMNKYKSDLPIIDLVILAALNIAEEKIKDSLDATKKNNELNNELKQINNYVKKLSEAAQA